MSILSPQEFLDRLYKIRLPDCFNPYRDRCPVYDTPSATQIRADCLLRILQEATKQEIHSLWVGRDYSHRGGRRTGLAFTDDFHFDIHTERFGFTTERPCTGNYMKEQSATVVWTILNKIDEPFFLWNVFPYHPHPIYAPYSNRLHTNYDAKSAIGFLVELIKMIKPKKFFGIGVDAYNALSKIRHYHDIDNLIQINDIHLLRHPSHGGTKKFKDQTSKHYNLPQPEQLTFEL